MHNGTYDYEYIKTHTGSLFDEIPCDANVSIINGMDRGLVNLRLFSRVCPLYQDNDSVKMKVCVLWNPVHG